MATGPMHVTVPLPDLLAHAGKAKQAARSAAQEYRALAAEIKRAQAAGQSVGAGQINRLQDLDKIRETQRQIVRHSGEIRRVAGDLKFIKAVAGAQIIKDLTSGNASAADIVSSAAMFSMSGTGQKIVQKILRPLGGKFAGSFLNVMPVAAVAAQVTDAVFDYLIKQEDIRKDANKALGETIDLGRDNFLDPIINRRIRREARDEIFRKHADELGGLSEEHEEKAAKEGKTRVAELLRARKFAREVADTGSMDFLARRWNLSEKNRQMLIDGVLSELDRDVLRARLSQAEASAREEARAERQRQMSKSPSDLFLEQQQNRIDEISFQRRRGLAPLRYGD